MAPTRPRSLSTRLNTVIALLLVLVSSARGHPLSGQELDSAVDGVQRYLESSGFPKMTRGEVLDFLNDFSRNSRVSRSQKMTDGDAKRDASPSAFAQSKTPTAPAPIPRIESNSAETKPKIPNGESPLNYGYPISLNQQRTSERPAESTTAMIFVTVPVENSTTTMAAADKKKETTQSPQRIDGRNAAKKLSTVPSVDLNAYTKFKKIPEAKNLKIDDDMKDFLNNFGLLDSPRSGEPKNGGVRAQRRNDDVVAAAAAAAGAESADEKLLKSVLIETGDANATQIEPFIASISKSDHVFNPTDSEVKTVDVNRIAKIVENIRLLTEDNATVSLPPEVIQQKFDNITAAISAIDRPADGSSGSKAGGFDGYEVFFDDSSKEVDSDLPADSPVATNAAVVGPGSETLIGALHPPDPLSTDELQRLSEKNNNNKSDVKRQQPTVNETTDAVGGVSTEDPEAVSTSSEAVVTANEFLEATSFKSASDAPSTADAPSASSTATAAATEANPSLSQLAESFGGGETASEAPPAAEDSIATAAPSNRPKNGLYFYVDWNSFLTVNNGQRNQVNLRFAPKAGNPAHFLRVNVP